MLIVHSALGYCVLFVIAYLIGRRTRSIPWKTLGVATALQLLLAAILLQPAIRSLVFGLASDLTTLLKKTALTANESLLFSGVSAESFAREHGPVVALEIAAILIFVASLSHVLYPCETQWHFGRYILSLAKAKTDEDKKDDLSRPV